MGIIRTLVAAGGSLNAINKDSLTPLQLAEKPEPPGPNLAAQMDPGVFRVKRDTREEVIAALRELMKLGPDPSTPVPVPAPADPGKKVEDKKEAQK